MKTFQQLIDLVPEDVTYDRGFRLVDSILCSKNGLELKEAIDAGDEAKAEVILRLHSKLAREITEAKKCIFKKGVDKQTE